VGLFLAFFARSLFNATQDHFLLTQTKGATDWGPPPMEFGSKLRLYYGSSWAGLVTIVGIALVGLAYWLYQGKKWAWPLALTCLAVVAIGGLYNFLGFFATLGGFPPSVITFFIGLVAFWAMLLLQPNERNTKIALFTVLTLMGMIGAQAGIFAMHGILKTFPFMFESLTEPSVMILRHSGPVLGAVLILIVLSIPFVALRKDFGWLMAFVVGVGTVTAAFPVYLIRPSASLVAQGEATFFTNAFAEVSVLGFLLTIVLLLPFFRRHLNGPMPIVRET
jgi:hypothetical protein